MHCLISICTSWGPKYGGINSFNYDFLCSISKLQSTKLKVYCIVSNKNDKETNDAYVKNITLISLNSSSNNDDEWPKNFDQEILEQVSIYNYSSYLIIGHDVFTGNIAFEVKNFFLKRSKKAFCFIIHHMNYEAYEGFKNKSNSEINRKILAQREILQKADRVFAIGPKLFDSAKSKIQSESIEVNEIIPGIIDLPKIPGIPLSNLRAITFGRYDQKTDVIKQINLVAAAYGKARDMYNERLGNDSILTVVGLTSENENSDAEAIKKISYKYSKRLCSVNCYPFTTNRDELFSEIRRNHVCLMLSLHEGFGLVGIEAISAEVPLILSKNTGLYTFIKNQFGDIGLENISVVDIRGTNQKSGINIKDVLEVASRLAEIGDKKELYMAKAKRLKKLFIDKGLTWESSAISFIDILNIDKNISNKLNKGNNKKPLVYGLHKLPNTDPTLIGRSDFFKKMTRSFRSLKISILEIVADGGIGKTAMVNSWAKEQEKKNRTFDFIFAWSFYEQGYKESFVSADLFIESALNYFGDVNPSLGSSFDKGQRLAALLLQKKGLIILDGLEPLQFPPGHLEEGKIKDEALSVFLREISQKSDNSGFLCVITTRIQVKDIFNYEGTSIMCEFLQPLSKRFGALLLRNRGVIGTLSELGKISERFKGNPLIIKLLGSYLKYACNGKIDSIEGITSLKIGDKRDTNHLAKVLQSYENWFGKASSEIRLLKIISLFERPVEAQLVFKVFDSILLKKFNYFDSALRDKVNILKSVSLIDSENKSKISLHPLIKEFFFLRSKKESKSMFLRANDYLFKYYSKSAEKFPSSLETMDVLFQAIVFAVRAKRINEAILIYKERIMRGGQYFASNELGLFNSLLSVLMVFFTDGQRNLYKEMSSKDRLFILKETIEYSTIVFGYSNEIASFCFDEVELLSVELSDFRSSFELLLAKCRFNRMKGALSKSGEIANQLAEISSTRAAYKVYANRALATYLFYIGNFKESYKVASVGGLKYITIEEGRERAKFDINEPYISCLGYCALSLRIMNKRKMCSNFLKEMIEAANEISHPHTLIVATFISTMVWQFEGNKTKTKSEAENLIKLCIQYGVRLWKIAGEILYNWADSNRDSTKLLERGIENWLETGAVLFMPYWKGLLGDKYLEGKRKPKEALLIVEEGINYTESWWQAELWRIKGLCVFALKKANYEKVSMDAFFTGLRIAEKQEAVIISKRIKETMKVLNLRK